METRISQLNEIAQASAVIPKKLSLAADFLKQGQKTLSETYLSQVLVALATVKKRIGEL